jgi:hypothetical protein
MLAVRLLVLPFDRKDGSSAFLLNVSQLSLDYTALYPRRQHLFYYIYVE